ncbi:MAG: adenosylmethionine--8-amino-7-oxononanoate transaminase [Planctomycetota bacterium]|nr:adenosylmethionine--8-amino-7-oxononanoate transaminase [Planctomycetota bacterium]
MSQNRQRLPSLLIVGTDTDAGKTTLAALLRHAATQGGENWRYWKPIQSGAPDTDRIRSLCPDACVLDAVYEFEHPAAPDASAAKAGVAQPKLATLIEARPTDAEGPLMVESLGGPLSPIASDTLQIDWFVALRLPAILVAPNRVGTINACLANLTVLRDHGIPCLGIVLMGPSCENNANSLADHGGVPVHEVDWPADDTQESYAARASGLTSLLEQLGKATGEVAPADDLRTLDERNLWHPYTPLREEDERPVCLRAEGEWLHLDTGEVLVDGISSWWTCIHGHAHPRIRSALAAAARKHDQVIFAGLSHEPAIRLAEELLDLMPASFQRVFYSDNGSTAMEVALKIVHGYWRRLDNASRNLFLCFEGAYHGDTFGTMAIGRDPVFFAEFEDMLFEVVQIPMQESALTTAIEQYGDRLAGVIVEPLIQAASGMRFQTPDQLERLCQQARAAELPVIFDEVMTGFGRTGRLFAMEHLQDFVPDLVCLAKGLSGGVLPLAATVVNHRVCEPWLDGNRAKMLFHGHSYTANPLACATGRAGLALFRDHHALDEARRIEAFWRQAFGGQPADETWRILGTVIATNLGSGGYLSEQRQQIIAVARREGVFLRPLGDVVYAMPPLCTGQDALEQIANALRGIRDEFSS